MLLLIHRSRRDIKVRQGALQIIQAGWRQQFIVNWRQKNRKISPTSNLARGHPSPQVLVGSPSRLAWYTGMHNTQMHSHTLCCVKIAVLYRPEISKGASI